MAECITPSRTLDVRGLFCPEPVYRTRLEMDGMKPGEVLEVLADDPTAEADIQAWARKAGQQVLKIEKNGMDFRFIIKKAK